LACRVSLASQRAHTSAEEYLRCLEPDILPFFGERYVEDITAADMAELSAGEVTRLLAHMAVWRTW